eukprot:1443287-Rhodomonas_salina.2
MDQEAAIVLLLLCNYAAAWFPVVSLQLLVNGTNKQNRGSMKLPRFHAAFHDQYARLSNTNSYCQGGQNVYLPHPPPTTPAKFTITHRPLACLKLIPNPHL